MATTVEVTTAGTLESVVNDLDEPSFPTLKIVGTLNADDIKFLHSPTGRMGTVRTLDLSEVTIVQGGDAYATISYSDNTVTMDNYLHTFFLSDDVYEEKSSQGNMLGGINYTIVHHSNDLSGAFAQTPYQHIIMPNYVKKAGDMTFYKCASLTTVEFPAGLEHVGLNAFQQSSIETVDLSKVVKMEKYAFNACVHLIGGADGILDLSSLDSIPSYAFSGTSGVSSPLLNLKEVKFSNQLCCIGERAFNSSGLTEVDFPESLKKIDNYAFEGCESLQSVVLPKSLESLGDGAFRICSHLASVELPSTLQHLSYGMFGGTPWIESQRASARSDGNIFYLNTTALRYVGSPSEDFELTFRDGTTEIGDEFMESYITECLKSIQFPSSLKVIGKRAFQGGFQSPLTILSLPEGLEEIGDEAFYEFLKLTSVSMPSTLKIIGDKAFSRCESLSEIDLPDALETIGDEAFSRCGALTTIVFPESLKSIGTEAFRYCSLLSGDITIPEGVEKLGDGIFFGTSIWRIFYQAKNAVSIYSGVFGSDVERVVIGSNVEVIPSGCFSGCANLKKLTFEERSDETSLVFGKSCFADCSELQSITLPRGTLLISSGAFNRCSGLVNVESLGVVTEIQESAFESCDELKAVTFPDGLQNVGTQAFNSCSNLQSVSLGNSLKSIGESAFRGDSYGHEYGELTEIQFGDQLESVGAYAFARQKMESIDLGEKVESIGDAAFSGCLYLQNINLPRSTKSIGNWAFSGCTSLSSIKLSEGLEDIGDGVFNECPLISELVLPSTVKKIGEQLFYGRSISNFKIELIESNIQNPEDVVCTGDPFYRFYDKVTLRVPAGTIRKYRNTYPWSQFRKIEEKTADESEYALTAADVTIEAGRSEDLLVSLSNKETLKGFQFELTLPEGVAVKAGDSGTPVAELTERGEGLTIIGSKDPSLSNTYIFVVMSFGGATIAAGEGEVVHVPLNADIETSAGNYDVTIKETSVSDTKDNTFYLKSATSQLTVTEAQYAMGDANHDGRVNVTDVIAIVNRILKQDHGVFNTKAADMNGDGLINVTDALMVVDLILKK